jgi:DNA-directed RNA polymerase
MSDTNYNLLMAYGDITDEQMERELNHEDAMIARGVDRFYKSIERERDRGSASSVPGGRALISQMTMTLADLILDEVSRLESGRVKRKPPELKNLQLLPAKDTAALAIKTVLDACSLSKNAVTSQKLSHKVGTTIEAEYIVRALTVENKALYNGIVKNVAKRSSSLHQLKTELTNAATSREGISPPLTTQEKVRVGMFICEAMVSCGILESHTVQRHRRRVKEYMLSDLAFNIVMSTNDLVSEMRPYVLPTLIPPAPWTDRDTGGYWKEGMCGRFVTRRSTGKYWRFKATDMDAPKLYTGVNYLQSVPFRVHPGMLEVVLQMREGNVVRAGLPPAELEPFPAKPFDIDSNEDARRAYAKAKAAVHTRNAQMKGKILATEKTVMVAAELAGEDTIYFPKFVDFRGRVYDYPSYLHPQGNDLSKGLLQFANGKPLTEDGRRWLAIHTANCFGLDKAPLDERVAWVDQNMERLVITGRDPMGSDRSFWMDADEPFQFLASCMEWAGYAEQGEGYLSHLPVAMDGSCNGLQHFSAMLRDPVGGKATNLTVEDRPQDIYTEVLNEVKKVLKQEEDKGERLARQWLPLMKRKVVKRPVMTLPYGANKTTFIDQIKADTLAPLEAEGDSPFESSSEAAKYLARILWDAVGSVVVAAQAAMGWLQEVAGIAVDNGNLIEWTTPVGFPVMQEYREAKMKQVFVACMGQKLKVNVPLEMEEQDGKLRKKKMKNAISPNFVHSLDAAHMLLTVEAFRKATGNTGHLAMVHDSYACHASDAAVLADVLRKTFVDMYQDTDVLLDFANEVKAMLPEDVELPPIPPKGSLELDKVLESKYFFA